MSARVRWTLYVARDKRWPRRHDVGSVLCLEVADTLGDALDIVECTSDVASRPGWLVGTPTLATDDGIFRGHSCFSELLRAALTEARAQGAEAQKAPSAVAKGGRGHTMPTVRLRPEGGAKSAHSAVGESAAVGDGGDEDDPWIVPTHDDDDGGVEDERKLTSADLARALQQRDVAPPPQ